MLTIERVCAHTDEFALDVLKFEYLTQLLVDANYIPVVLKLLSQQEVEKLINYKCENEDYK